MEANLEAAAPTFLVLPGARLLDVPGLLGVVTDVPLSFFNFVPRTALRDRDDLDGIVAGVLAESARRRVPCRWWFTPGTRPAAVRLVLERRMRLHYRAPAMVAELDGGVLEQPLPDGVEVERVRDLDALGRFAEVLLTAFERPRSDHAGWIAAFGAIGLGEQSPWQHFVATIEGRTVATASVFLGGGTAGVYHVGTLPAARGRGAGGAVTRVALADALERGVRTSVLQSSDEAYRIYQRLGFVQVAEVDAFELP